QSHGPTGALVVERNLHCILSELKIPRRGRSFHNRVVFEQVCLLALPRQRGQRKNWCPMAGIGSPCSTEMTSFNGVRLATEFCVGNPLTICGSCVPSLVGMNGSPSHRFESPAVNREYARGIDIRCLFSAC